MSTGRALLVSPAFFGYERDIAAELERQGWDTVFVDERPSNSALMRAVIRVRRSLLGRLIQAHYRSTLDRLRRERFDLVVVIKGEVVPAWFLRELRALNPGAAFVFYAYDAVGNSPNCLGLLDQFDARLSFDRDDVEAHAGFGYLPLFHTPEFRPLPAEQAAGSRRHRWAFVGTLHSGRYAFVRRLIGDGEGDFTFFYVQARWYFALTKYVTRENRSVPWRDVSFTPLTRAQIAEVFRHSVAVLDMQRPGQSGLTMRTLEVLASGSILVTTNPSIAQEPFYDPRRVVILPDEGRTTDAAQLLADVVAAGAPAGAPPGFEAYSLESFVRQLVAAGVAGERPGSGRSDRVE
ncbi:CgeB family protein [Aeromicrobium choanae]|uniref:Spore maturation protein CgeB n=1 Tax=Aeromicrobium choanae TaxID=1736691 RepID=A0A1T4YZS7_9ACTN|nr:hypothetical protein [Aeromicrobium choanae]SKB07317.1 hypothetical protein SAMN06295964_1656 [Aeromicrobium choanae]